jgi:hypothetical protein
LRRAGQTERPCYFGLAKALGFKYFSIEPPVFDFDKEMLVEVARLEKILKSLTNELVKSKYLSKSVATTDRTSHN